MAQINYTMLGQLRADYELIRQQGSPLLACQGMIVPKGMEHMRFLIKSGLRPIVSNGDPAEVQYAGGFVGLVAGVPNTKYSGTMQIIVTEAACEQAFAEYIVNSGGQIDCTYYDGRMDSFTRAYELLNCTIRFEGSEFDSESKSQVATISAPFDFNYFGLFADIGKNGTVQVGQRKVPGADGFLAQVQSMLQTQQAAIGIGGGVGNGIGGAIGGAIGKAVGSLFGG